MRAFLLATALVGCIDERGATRDDDPDAGPVSEEAVVWASDDECPQHLALDETHVWWSTWSGSDRGAGHVRRVPRAGGAVETIASVSFTLGPVAVTDDAAWWLDGDRGGWVRWPKAGGEPALADVGPGGWLAVAGGRDLFVASEGTLVRVADGEAPRAIPEPGVVRQLALDASHVYWTRAADGGWWVGRAARSGGDVSWLAKGAGDPSGLHVEAGQVYVSAHAGPAISRFPSNGGAVEALRPAADAPGGPDTRQVVAWSGRLYWVSQGEAGAQLMTQPRPGGAPNAIPLEAPFTELPRVVADPAGVYVGACNDWSEPGAILHVRPRRGPP